MAAVTLATTASADICAHVPSVYTSFGCPDSSWGWESDGRIAVGVEHGVVVSKALWRWSRAGFPEALPGFTWPLIPSRSALSHFTRGREVLQPYPTCSPPASRPVFLTPDQTLASAPANLYLPPRDEVRGRTALGVRRPPSPVCVIIFVKIVLSVVLPQPPRPQPRVQSVCLPGLPAPHLAASGSLPFVSNLGCQAQPAEAGTQQPAQSTCSWRERKGTSQQEVGAQGPGEGDHARPSLVRPPPG